MILCFVILYVQFHWSQICNLIVKFPELQCWNPLLPKENKWGVHRFCFILMFYHLHSHYCLSLTVYSFFRSDRMNDVDSTVLPEEVGCSFNMNVYWRNVLYWLSDYAVVCHCRLNVIWWNIYMKWTIVLNSWRQDQKQS